jgi:hypothetical protein
LVNVIIVVPGSVTAAKVIELPFTVHTNISVPADLSVTVEPETVYVKLPAEARV